MLGWKVQDGLIHGSWRWPWVSSVWPPIFQLATVSPLHGSPRVALKRSGSCRLLRAKLQCEANYTRPWRSEQVTCPAQIPGVEKKTPPLGGRKDSHIAKGPACREERNPWPLDSYCLALGPAPPTGSSPCSLHGTHPSVVIPSQPHLHHLQPTCALASVHQNLKGPSAKLLSWIVSIWKQE